MTRHFAPTTIAATTAAAAAVITAADKAQSSTGRGFSSFTFRQRIILLQVLLEKVKGTYMQDALDTLDPDAELGEAEQFCWLHSDEPQDSILGLLLAVVLSLR